MYMCPADQVELMTKYVRDFVRGCKREGTTGMSFDNLVQCVNTRGITVHPNAFGRLVEQAIEAAGLKSFIVG